MRRSGWLSVLAAVIAVAGCASDEGRSSPSVPDSAGVAPAATATGVDTDTIAVGVLAIDYDLLRELGLVDINRGDDELVWQVFVDELNDRGGIHGRRLDLHWRPYSVVNPQGAEEVCIELTEDVGVFASLTGFNGPAQSADDCLANQHQTVLISDVAAHEQMLAAAAPWIQIGTPGNERLDRALVDLAHEAGHLEAATVAVHTLASDADRVPAVVDRLEQLGVEVALETVNDAPTTDPAEGEAQWKVIAERMREAGVDTVIVPSSVVFAYGQIINNDLDVQVLTSDIALGDIGGFGNHPPEAYAGAIGVFGRLAEESFAAPEYQRCLDVFEEATGFEVLPSPQVPDGEADWQVPVTTACNRLALFEQLATEAGPGLDNDSFRAAVESDPELRLPAVPFASFGPDKYDGNDSLRLVEFDPSVGTAGGLRPLTEVMEID